MFVVDRMLAADKEAIGVQGGVEITAVELPFARIGVVVEVGVEADRIADLPVIAGVVVDLLTGAVVIVVFPVVAKLAMLVQTPAYRPLAWLSMISSCAAGSPMVCEIPLER